MNEHRETIAAFVTPHGFGHAARTCAVVEALARRRDDLRVELVTTVPRWFFDDSLTVPFGYHEIECDVGMVQRDALSEDPAATADQVERLLEGEARLIADIVARLQSRGCRLVMSDIAPLGLVVARRLDLPSVLVENFTWDWIYRAYAGREPRLEALAEAMSARFALADRRLQVRPVCEPLRMSDDSVAVVDPIARRPRRSPAETRAALEIGDHERGVLLSMGGIPWDYGDVGSLELPADVVLVVPGGAAVQRRAAGAVLLPFRSSHFHPDLVQAVDAVVAKLGYSTVAEAYDAGRRLGYVRRSRFPESRVLEAFVAAQLPAIAIEEDELRDGTWIGRLPELLALSAQTPPTTDGADQAAAMIDELL